jgi:glycosyltransferase involved in cell wall biosynthesis
LIPVKYISIFINSSNVQVTKDGMKKPPICIVSEFAYPLIVGSSEIIGGSETQMTNIAEHLVLRGYDVSLLTFGASDKKMFYHNGVKIFVPFDSKRLYSFLFPHNFIKLLKTLLQIDYSVLIQSPVSLLTAFLILFSKFKNKIYVFSIASNRYFIGVNSQKNGLISIMEKFFIRYSDYFTVQTMYQKKHLLKMYSKEGCLIGNSFVPFDSVSSQSNEKNNILWIGKFFSYKNPQLFVNLAIQFPNQNFIMIGGPTNSKLFTKIYGESIEIENLTVVGSVPHREIGKYIGISKILINFSTVEGFPNVFLEAWGDGLPVLSNKFDPDGVIEKYNLGFCATSYSELVSKLQTFLDNPQLMGVFEKTTKDYVQKYHSLNEIADKYELFIDSLL